MMNLDLFEYKTVWHPSPTLSTPNDLVFVILNTHTHALQPVVLARDTGTHSDNGTHFQVTFNTVTDQQPRGYTLGCVTYAVRLTLNDFILFYCHCWAHLLI